MTPAANPEPGRRPESAPSRSREGRELDALKLPAFDRWRRAFRALRILAADPNRTDMVLEFSFNINAGSMAQRVSLFHSDPTGRRLSQEQRKLDSKTVDLNALGQLPDGTLGRVYADFMRANGLTPEVFDDAPEEVSDPQAAYFIQRMRQTHDLWHVVTGYETDALGEVLLQAFTYAQMRAPSNLVIALIGTTQGIQRRRSFPREVIAAYRVGRRAAPLWTFPWEDCFSTPLAQVREQLGILL